MRVSPFVSGYRAFAFLAPRLFVGCSDRNLPPQPGLKQILFISHERLLHVILEVFSRVVHSQPGYYSLEFLL